MPLWQHIYIACWVALSLLGAGLLAYHRTRFELCQPPYWRFLLRPWKIISFGIAWGGLVLFGPYSGDPTWDWFDASFMSLLTFTTAPWVVAMLYLGVRRQRPPLTVFVAVVVWMFSASWSYDGYMLLKTGVYPRTWSSNIAASSVLYLSAGALWSLEWTAERRVHPGFVHDDWPARSPGAVFPKLLPYALAIMIPITLGFGLFLI